ncbi:hypothetical protein AAK964_03360 [Tissierella praeacuta]|uniref:hypothetical protein n=1 Tax=Tissierella praeacuta TaxID=43131 RepID=UPI003517369A
MVNNYEIYLGNSIIEAIEKELKNKQYNWYKESRVEQEDGTWKEINYFLSEDYLLIVKTDKDKCIMKKINISQIGKVEKEYNFVEDFGIKTALLRVSINVGDEVIILERPIYNENGDIKGFENLAELL